MTKIDPILTDTNFWTALNSVASIITALAAVGAMIGAWFAYKQLMVAGRQLNISRTQFGFEAWNKAQDLFLEDEFTELRGKVVFSRLDEPNKPWTDDEVKEAKRLCRKFEEFSQLAPYIGRDRFLKVWDDPVGKAWFILELIVREEQDITGWTRKWAGFEEMGKAALEKLILEGRFNKPTWI